MARPAIACERHSRDGDGLVIYELKHPFRDGTTHVLFEPLDFMARLAAREVRQPRGREGVGERGCVASAAVDLLRAPASAQSSR